MKKYFVNIFKIIIVIFFILTLYGYKKYQDWVKSPFSFKTPKYVLEEDNDMSEEVNLENVYKKVNYEYLENNLGHEFKNIYYSGAKMEEKYYIYMGLLPEIEKEIKINCNLEKVVTANIVDDNIKKVFGNIKYLKKNFEFLDKSVKVDYDNIKDSYLVKTTKCSGVDYSNGGIKSEYFKAYQGDKSAVIEEKVYYLKTLVNPYGIIYNYYAGIDNSSKVISNSYEKIDYNILPVYKLIFKREGNNYFFYKVDKIKE